MTIKKVAAFSGIMLAISAAALIASLFVAHNSQLAIEEASETRRVSQALADELRESSRRLTTAVRKYTVTGDERFADEYNEIVRVRAGRLPRPADCAVAPGLTVSLNELMKKARFTDREFKLMQLASDLSNDLIHLEVEAMNAVRGLFRDAHGAYTIKGKPDKARATDLVFNDAYNAEVAKIMAPFSIFKQELDERLNHALRQATARHERCMLVVWMVTALVLISFGAYLLLVNRMIVRPILLCDEFAKNVAAGLPGKDLAYKSGNEIGSLAESLRSMFASFQERINLKEQAEQAMREAARAAQESSRIKSTFLANISHEIRTPMNGIIGFSELAMDGELNPRARDYLRKIKSSAEILLRIINDILDISKIESGRMVLENTPFSMHDVFEACETVSAPKAMEKGVTLHFYSEPLAGKTLVGDSARLRQILLNLIFNAIKFTSNGVVKVKALVEQESDDEVLLAFEVRDSGIGMSEAQIEDALEPFVQVDGGLTRKHGGVGLGLAITKSLIALMGGALKIESLPGIGSKFSFSLRIQTTEGPLRASEREKENGVGGEKPLFAGNVLVCEDNEANQEVVVEHLARVGLTATVAANGKTGVELAKARLDRGQPFDLIFMDIHMPVMDGLEASALLAEAGNQAPIVALTANVMANDRAKYTECGMVECLSKPFKAVELWACLARYLPAASRAQGGGGSERTVPAASGGAGQRPSAIDRELGLEHSAGSMDLYKRLLSDFAKNNKDICREISAAAAAGDAKLAHRLAHTLKSVSAMIGASALSGAAAAVEEELLSGPPAPQALERLRVELEAVLGEMEDVETEEAPRQPAGALDAPAARRLADRLGLLLASGNSLCLEMRAEIRDVFAPLGAICSTLARQIEDYDFDLALETLAEIKKLLIDTD